MTTVLDKLKSLVNQVEDKGCCLSSCAPVCSPPNFPYLQVCMLDPPCTVVPTEPKYVKPLCLPSSPPPPCNSVVDPEEEYKNRRANFYNYHNVDYHKNEIDTDCKQSKSNRPVKNPRCQKLPCECDPNSGCPTGFKPCQIKLCPPAGCHPLGTWKATVQPCPPKPSKRASVKYEPGECTRPCCLHWKPKGGVCKYDKPCKAHCYDHPFGVKPSGKPC